MTPEVSAFYTRKGLSAADAIIQPAQKLVAELLYNIK